MQLTLNNIHQNWRSSRRLNVINSNRFVFKKCVWLYRTLYSILWLFSFSTGRHTALVLDSGSTYTSATPVYEGYPIISSVVKSPVAGDLIIDQCRRMLTEEQKIELVPYYKVASKVGFILYKHLIRHIEYTEEVFRSRSRTENLQFGKRDSHYLH